MNLLRKWPSPILSKLNFSQVLTIGSWILGKIILFLVCIIQQELAETLIFQMIFLPQSLGMKRMKIQISIYEYSHVVPVYFVFNLPFSYFLTVKHWWFVLQNPCSLSWKPVATLYFFVLALCCFEPLSLIFKY